MSSVATTARAQARLFKAQYRGMDRPCGVALYDPVSGETAFRFRDDWADWAGEESAVLAAIAEDLPAKCAEMGAESFFRWIDDTLSNTFRVEDPQPVLYARLDQTADNLYRRKVQGERIGVMLPLHQRRVAAGPFRCEEEDAVEAEIEAPPEVRGGPGWFAVRVVGHSMEPEIPDGSIAIFRPYHGGTRANQIVLVEQTGPDGLSSWTLKRYHSRKREHVNEFGETEWEHEGISMESENPEFAEWDLDESRQYRTLGVFVQVLTD